MRLSLALASVQTANEDAAAATATAAAAAVASDCLPVVYPPTSAAAATATTTAATVDGGVERDGSSSPHAQSQSEIEAAARVVAELRAAIAQAEARAAQAEVRAAAAEANATSIASVVPLPVTPLTNAAASRHSRASDELSMTPQADTSATATADSDVNAAADATADAAARPGIITVEPMTPPRVAATADDANNTGDADADVGHELAEMQELRTHAEAAEVGVIIYPM